MTFRDGLAGFDEQTHDVTAAELAAAALPFQRNAAKSRVSGPIDVAAHARLAARLVAAPHEAMADLRASRLDVPESRAVADAVMLEMLATDRNSALAWIDAFERELARYT